MNRNVEGPSPLRPMVVVRGSIADRPWGATLAAIGLSGRTGQLTLNGPDDHQQFQIAFVNGLVVGATSPFSADSIARVALGHKLISAVQARAYGKLDDLERFADAVKLSPQQTQLLKRRTLIQRVARTFSIDTGDYLVDERSTIAVVVGVEVDIRPAIYLGMRMNLSQQRLTRTLHRVGISRFQLRPDEINQLALFELGAEEQVVIDALHNGSSLAEIEAMDRELDPRMVEALLCTLAVCDAVTQTDLVGRVPTPQQTSLSRTPTPREPTVTRTPTPRDPTITSPYPIADEQEMSSVPMLIRQDPDVTVRPPRAARVYPELPPPLPAARVQREVRIPPVPSGLSHPVPVKPRPVTRRPTEPRVLTKRTFTDPFLEAQPTRRRPEPLAMSEINELIEVGTILLERGVDHFSFLGLSFLASVEEVREAYLEFARYLRPEKLAELGIRGRKAEDANAVFAQVVIAHTILTDPVRRTEYVSGLVAIRARARR